MVNQTVEDRFNAGIAVIDRAYDQPVTRESWGFYSVGDGPGAAGGGIGGFTIFANRCDMLDFLAEHIAWCPPGPRWADADAVAASVRAIVQRHRDGTLGPETTLDQLNRALVHFSVLLWWGPLSDLLTSNEDLPAEVRASYWNADDYTDGQPVPPVPDSEFDDFADHVRHYM